MIYLFYTFIETIYYIFIVFLIQKFNNYSLILASPILLVFSLFIAYTLFILMHFLKNKKHFFIISTFFIIIVCSIFRLFGENILNICHITTGLSHFTIYIFKILFMFSPFLSIYFLGFYKTQKKQLYLIIALKRLFSVFISFILLNFCTFTNLIFILAFSELILNILPFINFKNK